jgi:hypothetical protein
MKFRHIDLPVSGSTSTSAQAANSMPGDIAILDFRSRIGYWLVPISLTNNQSARPQTFCLFGILRTMWDSGFPLTNTFYLKYYIIILASIDRQ